ncbi:hypothetical protein [Paenibacillus macquariensis]|uniref:DUF4367 domain-containing protein n=1 Tax=Paenibacillus macquariensis TaxID=948756 RepID=A0ABY1K5N5_9BACL|nr:hypothetical protein [Paenibacillus macquariensis]MEC0090476.1 hypothetical protein [Paenibacillus macquariensis]OAB38481.1 hypothetical protein PMSM_01365 [Paenibacillus macquariensis subsp. macquariensis]SIR29803.1 hypothetical protein SAMN05421578_11097 [Paenibacillus macquariensis]
MNIDPNFSKFDSETSEEKEAAYLNFMKSQRIRDKFYYFLRPVLKVMLLLLCIASLFGIVIAISGIPSTIDKEYAAVQFRMNDDTYVENITISVKGKLYTRFFSDPKFKGSIMIDNFEYTKTNEVIDITFYKSMLKGGGMLHYTPIDNGTVNIEALGVIWMSDHFDKLTIWVFEPLDGDRKSTTDLIISAPANSRKEAIQIVEQLSHYTEQYKEGD